VWGGQLREETWNKHFEQLKEYVKEHGMYPFEIHHLPLNATSASMRIFSVAGNALVPINAPGGLGFWVHRQRRSYRTWRRKRTLLFLATTCVDAGLRRALTGVHSLHQAQRISARQGS